MSNSVCPAKHGWWSLGSGDSSLIFLWSFLKTGRNFWPFTQGYIYKLTQDSLEYNIQKLFLCFCFVFKVVEPSHVLNYQLLYRFRMCDVCQGKRQLVLEVVDCFPRCLFSPIHSFFPSPLVLFL